jgi:hypothetical protein
MARNEWSRWGRGSCEGYSLDIGNGGFVRFEGSVVCAPGAPEGAANCWTSSINGTCMKMHDTCAEAMARVEFELAETAEAFVSLYAGYKAHRHKNKFSRAVDALKSGAAA